MRIITNEDKIKNNQKKFILHKINNNNNNK